MTSPRSAPLISFSLLGLVVVSALSCSRESTAPKVNANGFASISAGGAHTCALTSTGVAYCWGSNDRGQLGDSSLVLKTVPVPVAGGLRFASIAAGYEHTCALTTSGIAYCWGWNASGQLGDGTLTQRTTPTRVGGGITFASIATGARSDHTCGVAAGGVTYCWGLGDSDQLGTALSPAPLIPDAVQGGLIFADVTPGSTHTCALTKAGVAYCWGDNGGELGIGLPDTTVIAAPVAVGGNLTFSSLAAGVYFTCGVTSADVAYCWGDNDNGELGDGTLTVRDAPTAVQGGLHFTMVAPSGGAFSCGLASDGTAHCWGDNFYYELGDGTSANRLGPVAVSGSLIYRTIASGGLHTCALTPAGVAYCWGNNGHGELGTGSKNSSNIPAAVTMP